MKKEWAWKITGGALLLLLAGASLLIWSGARRLNAVKAALAADGETLNWRDLEPPVTDSRSNGEADYLDAINANRETFRGLLVERFVAHGRRIPLTWYENLPVENTDCTVPRKRTKRWTTNIWQEAELMVLKEDSWTAACRAATNEVIRLQINWDKGPFTPMPHCAGQKYLIVSLRAGAMLDLRRGDLDLALEKVLLAFRLLEIYEEPAAISAYVRYSVAHRLYTLGWEMLQHDGWIDSQLAELQTAVESVRNGDFFAAAFPMERALTTMGWEEIVRDTSILSRWRPSPYYDWERFYAEKTPLWRMFNANADLAWYLNNTRKEFQIVSNAFKARSLQELAAAYAKGSPEIPPLHFFSRTARIPMEERAMRFFFAETHREMLTTAIALKLERLQYGRYPEELSVLVPEYLKELPVDWMNGKHLRYERVSPDKFRLWSVGRDLIDDDGNPNPRIPSSHMHRESGRDFVWPEVAEPAEVEKWIKSELRKFKPTP
ncbi:MAG: hypothetical protein ACPGVU_18490, partial [Limisphaerales bacterium]